MDIIYRIRQKRTGLFSSGGSCPCFRKKGKIWRTRSALMNHVGLFIGNTYRNTKYGPTTFDDLEIVTYEISECPTVTEPFADARSSLAERRAKREATQKERDAQYRLSLAQQDFERAKERLEKLKEIK